MDACHGTWGSAGYASRHWPWLVQEEVSQVQDTEYMLMTKTENFSKQNSFSSKSSRTFGWINEVKKFRFCTRVKTRAREKCIPPQKFLIYVQTFSLPLSAIKVSYVGWKTILLAIHIFTKLAEKSKLTGNPIYTNIFTNQNIFKQGIAVCNDLWFSGRKCKNQN